LYSWSRPTVEYWSGTGGKSGAVFSRCTVKKLRRHREQARQAACR
jgi:hypothetical protein